MKLKYLSKFLIILLFTSRICKGEQDIKHLSPDGKFSTTQKLAQDGSINLSLVEVNSGKIVKNILSGVSKLHTSELWSPDSKYVFYHILYGTKGVTNLLLMTRKSEVITIRINDNNGEEHKFNGHELILVEWKNKSQSFKFIEIEDHDEDFNVCLFSCLIDDQKNAATVKAVRKERVKKSEVDEKIKQFQNTKT